MGKRTKISSVLTRSNKRYNSTLTVVSYVKRMVHSASVLPCPMPLTQALLIRIMKSANTTCARCGATLMLKFVALLRRFCPIAMILELLQSVSGPIASVQVFSLSCSF